MNSEIDSTRFQYGAVLVVHTAAWVIDDTWFAKFFHVLCNLYPPFVQRIGMGTATIVHLQLEVFKQRTIVNS
jgi:hypothetical protein